MRRWIWVMFMTLVGAWLAGGWVVFIVTVQQNEPNSYHTVDFLRYCGLTLGYLLLMYWGRQRRPGA